MKRFLLLLSLTGCAAQPPASLTYTYNSGLGGPYSGKTIVWTRQADRYVSQSGERLPLSYVSWLLGCVKNSRGHQDLKLEIDFQPEKHPDSLPEGAQRYLDSIVNDPRPASFDVSLGPKLHLSCRADQVAWDWQVQDGSQYWTTYSLTVPEALIPLSQTGTQDGGSKLLRARHFWNETFWERCVPSMVLF